MDLYHHKFKPVEREFNEVDCLYKQSCIGGSGRVVQVEWKQLTDSKKWALIGFDKGSLYYENGYSNLFCIKTAKTRSSVSKTLVAFVRPGTTILTNVYEIRYLK